MTTSSFAGAPSAAPMSLLKVAVIAAIFVSSAAFWSFAEASPCSVSVRCSIGYTVIPWISCDISVRCER